MPKHDDDYRPLPIFPPELARISVGVSNNGKLAVATNVSPRLVKIAPDLATKFDRAAAAFFTEFSKDEKLVHTELNRTGGALPEVVQVSKSMAERDDATTEC